MSKYLYILIILLSSLAFISFRTENNSQKLLGTWMSTTSEVGYTTTNCVTFKKDGTYTFITTELLKGLSTSEKGSESYTLNGNRITIDGSSDTPQNAIYSITNNKLEIIFSKENTNYSVIFTRQQ